ncbi:MAG: DNA mismatch repair protein MutS [Candidatus Delongbacteria bacterium]|nr:DNA mismatch repair protein MutS [Candidatus Delongbacteria bacterium]
MKKTKPDTLTPMMKQYQEIKSRNPDHILFYRLGDFYEMFFDDARTASKVLNLTLTTRGKHMGTEIPLAGFPHHQIDNYMAKMIKAGYKVAVCDQTENPKYAKGIVKRDVTEIVTAGTAMSENIIDSGRNNYICAISTSKKNGYGFAATDISTGEFVAYDTPSPAVLKEMIMLFNPSELLYDSGTDKKIIPETVTKTEVGDNSFDPSAGSEIIKRHFKLSSVSSLGFSGDEISLACAGVLIEYLGQNLKYGFSHLEKLKKYDDKNVCSIDFRTRRNLEILEPVNSFGNKNATLYSVMNRTNTPMGARLLRKWLVQPVRDKEEINRRLGITEIFVLESGSRKIIGRLLSEIGDIERLGGKISAKRIRPDEFIRLKRSLMIVPDLIKELDRIDCVELKDIKDSFADVSECVDFIKNSIIESESLNVKGKRFIKKGYSAELDELYNITSHGKDMVIALSEKVRKELNIPGLKIGFNRVFGYYFETTKKYSDMIPENYIRKQTLVNSERFINAELKELEEKILNADERIEDLAAYLYEEIKEKAGAYSGMLKVNSPVIAYLDCLCSYADIAESERFVRPEFSDKKDMIIKNGRHPVVEKNLSAGEDYIPNDLVITEDKNILIITGPNMSGKSTYLRQTAIIVLLAQAGSFVPAESAKIGMADKIFTRVGASDNLSGGESTFLVEMNETANILNNATPDSLIIFDEVGRGTATFDGLSLAWSIVEYIHDQPELSSRTLFATHYHELTEIDRICPRVKNCHASVTEHKDEIIFMRKIIEGAADHSYGIYVAKLAGIPQKILKRAEVILRNLEENELTPDAKPVIAKDKEKKIVPEQLSLFSAENDQLRESLRELNIDTITPIQALLKLEELKRNL